jgi:hypothetical protein
MRTTYGKLVRSADPNAASEGKSVFDWIPEPNGMQLLRGDKKTKVYQRKAPLVPSPIFDELETKWDAQLRGPLLRLQRLVEIKLQPNRYTTVDLMKEEAIEIQSILTLLVQILEQPKLIKYFKIKDNVLVSDLSAPISLPCMSHWVSSLVLPLINFPPIFPLNANRLITKVMRRGAVCFRK